MNTGSNHLKVSFLALLSFAAIGYLYTDWFSSFWPEEKKLSESVKLLQQRFNKQAPFDSNGWSLRNISVSDGDLFVVVNFPPRAPGKSRVAPVYSELMRYCPVIGEDGYWDKNFTRPFTLYLANTGKGAARAIARCNRLFDRQKLDRIAETGSAFGTQLVVVPKEGEEQQVLELAAASGTPIFNQAKKAMHSDKTGELQAYLNDRPELVDLYDSSGHTLLFSADTSAEVKILIGYGANPNVQQRNGSTALVWASELGRSYKAVKALIEAGADVSQVEVAFVRTGKIAQLLLEKGAQVSNNSLYEAISQRRNLDIVEVLYTHGARLDTTTLVSSPLHSLIRNAKGGLLGDLQKDLQLFDAALRLGANMEKRENDLTPLEYVLGQPDWEGREEIIAMLRNYGAE